MKIIIDSREPIEFLNNIKSNINNDIIIEVNNLNIGDIQIFKNNNDSEPIIIFERKSLNDLIASIKDGRYKEQSFRLNEHKLNNHNIYYIIEGNIQTYNKLYAQTIYSSIFALSYFKGFSLINSYNLNHTCEYIIKFSHKLLKEINKEPYHNNNNNNNNNNKNEYSSTLKPMKKNYITQNNILEIMLMQIPNVSNNVSKIIANKYKNIKNLIYILENDPNSLYSIIINENTKRRISKKTIDSLFDYLINKNND